MELLSHVVWSEGMYLTPLHFQTQSRCFEDSIHFHVDALWTHAWGFTHVSINEDALRNGLLVVSEAAGIFPDGVPFDLPGSDPLFPERALDTVFAPTDSALVLSLAIPRRRAGGALYAARGGAQAESARYSVVTRTFRDEVNGTDERELEFGVRNLRIVSAGELTPDLVGLPMVRILRDGRGAYLLDTDFIPASLRIGAGGALMLQLNRLIGSMGEKLTALGRHAHRRRRMEAGSSAMEVSSYWFLHALSSSLPVLRHQQGMRHTHPEQVFVELLRLAGALSTFRSGPEAVSMPAYNHASPTEGFQALDRLIRGCMEIVLPSNFVLLEFRPGAEPHVQEAEVTDERCLRRARWIFGLRAAVSDADLMTLAPRLVKICSARFVPELVRRALPGMQLRHLPIVPSAIHQEVDMQYFALDLAGPCWEHILETRRVGVYIPDELADAEFDLQIIVEAGA